MRFKLFTLLLLLSVGLAQGVDAGTIVRPSKTFGGTSFINGVIPQASDFNGDIDTIYSEFNGNIENANIKAAAAIAGTKVVPSFTSIPEVTNADTCYKLTESDQAADSKTWDMCSDGSAWKLRTKSDAGAVQNTWITIARADGAVTFGGPVSLIPTGTVAMTVRTTAPSGWLMLDGTSYTATTYANTAGTALFDLMVVNITGWGYPAAPTTTINAVDTGTETLGFAGVHGQVVNDVVYFNGSLPTTLASQTKYYVRTVPDTTHMTVSLTLGGSAVDLTSSTTGGSIYHLFKVPDMRSRVPVGFGTGTGLDNYTAGLTGGAEDAIVVTHNHGVTDAGHFHTTTAFSTGIAGGAGLKQIADGSSVSLQTDTKTTGLTVNNAGSSGTDANKQPFLTMGFMVKF